MPALDAYHKKVALAEDMQSWVYRDMLNYRVRSVRGDLPGSNSVPSYGIYGKGETGDSVFTAMQTALSASYCFYVSPHMDALVTAAAESMPEDALTHPSDPPTPQGFLWIPGGLTVIDIRGQILKYNAALWSVYGAAVHVWWLTDKYDEQDSTNVTLRQTTPPKMWATYPQLTPNGESRLPFGRPIPQAIGQSKVLPPEVRTRMQYDDATGKLLFYSPEGYTSEELGEMTNLQPKPDAVSRWLLAVWRLMGQTITELIPEEVPRASRKMARRVHLADEHVTVVDLRSSSTRNHGEGAVEWSHRWLVRGHWRMQPYKEDGEWVRKPIWIHPFVKGPEGAPLIVRDHVYDLRR